MEYNFEPQFKTSLEAALLALPNITNEQIWMESAIDRVNFQEDLINGTLVAPLVVWTYRNLSPELTWYADTRVERVTIELLYIFHHKDLQAKDPTFTTQFNVLSYAKKVGVQMVDILKNGSGVGAYWSGDEPVIDIDAQNTGNSIFLLSGVPFYAVFASASYMFAVYDA
jgi:hypothetical protein